ISQLRVLGSGHRYDARHQGERHRPPDLQRGGRRPDGLRFSGCQRRSRGRRFRGYRAAGGCTRELQEAREEARLVPHAPEEVREEGESVAGVGATALDEKQWFCLAWKAALRREILRGRCRRRTWSLCGARFLAGTSAGWMPLSNVSIP